MEINVEMGEYSFSISRYDRDNPESIIWSASCDEFGCEFWHRSQSFPKLLNILEEHECKAGAPVKLNGAIVGRLVDTAITQDGVVLTVNIEDSRVRSEIWGKTLNEVSIKAPAIRDAVRKA